MKGEASSFKIPIEGKIVKIIKKGEHYTGKTNTGLDIDVKIANDGTNGRIVAELEGGMFIDISGIFSERDMGFGVYDESNGLTLEFMPHGDGTFFLNYYSRP